MGDNILQNNIGLILIITIIFGISACTEAQKNENLSVEKKIFIDVTKKAGLSYVRDSFSHCWGDSNGDGLLDLFVINHFQRPLLFENNNDGTFNDVTTPAGLNRGGDQHGCAIGDYDNDGDKDFSITIGAAQGRGVGSNRLFLNNGNGVFTDVADEAGVAYPKGRGRTASWVDYNNDGLLDLFIANAKRENSSSVLFMNKGNGTFANVSVETGLAIDDNSGRSSWIDYDNDGFMDLTILKARNHEKHLIEIYKNIRGETFKKIKTFYGWTYAWGDYDNDGDLDIFISVPPRYYMYRADYESSLLSKIFRGFNKLYENTGDNKFVDVSVKAGFRNERGGDKPVFFDYDNDGDLDIYLLVSGTKKDNINDVMFENNGDKTFTNVTEKIGMIQHFNGRGRGIAYGDYDNDGFLDLFITNGLDRGKLVWGRDSGPYVLYKNIGNKNHWLKIKLIGSKSNRDGIGARVRLYIKDKLQYRMNNGGMEGYVQHGNPIHFGLGKAVKVDKIEVKWPSGILTNMENIKSDQVLVIKE